MRICCISDTHCQAKKIVMPDADILVHAGDALGRGEMSELAVFCDWMDRQRQYDHIIFVAGNHDGCFQDELTSNQARKMIAGAGVTYLQDDSVTIEGVKFYGSPWQPEFCNWAFNLPRGHMLREKWKMIPDDTNVLVTHGPPHMIGDTVVDGRNEGCRDLRTRIDELQHLKLHVFGHIHHSAGLYTMIGKPFVNAAICNERYAPVNPPIVVDI